MATGYEIYGPIPWRRPVNGTLNDPPTSPALGASYIIGTTPSGEWADHAGHIARWSGEEWKYEIPVAGWRTYNKETSTHRVFKATGWEDWAVGTTPGEPGSVSWGQIGGTLSAQIDLGTALSGKAASVHDHGLSYAAASHAHAPSDVTGTAIVEGDARLTDARTPTTHNHDLAYAAIDHTHLGGSDPWTVVKLDADFTSSLAANTNVTGLYFTPAANKTYAVYGGLLLRTATATVGARPGIAWPTVADGGAWVDAPNSVTTAAMRIWGAKTTQNAASTGLADTTNSHYARLEGLIVAGATPSGNFQITLASETAGTNVTLRAGSYIMYREL